MKKLNYIMGAMLACTFHVGVQAQTFTDTGIAFDPMTRARAEWVDFNNDGQLDLFVSGTNSSKSITYKIQALFESGERSEISRKISVSL